MPEQMLQIFGYMFLISLTAYTGSAQALFYEVGVQQTHWLMPQDFSTFLAFGFATPGPQVFTIATFIGYSAGGIIGALVATIAIFITPIILAIVAGRYLKGWIEGERAGYFVQAVGITAVGLLVAIGLRLLGANPITIEYGIIAALSFLAVGFWRINPFFVIVIGGLAGVFIK